jgi:hypothetical protein
MTRGGHSSAAHGALLLTTWTGGVALDQPLNTEMTNSPMVPFAPTPAGVAIVGMRSQA